MRSRAWYDDGDKVRGKGVEAPRLHLAVVALGAVKVLGQCISMSTCIGIR